MNNTAELIQLLNLRGYLCPWDYNKSSKKLKEIINTILKHSYE